MPVYVDKDYKTNMMEANLRNSMAHLKFSTMDSSWQYCAIVLQTLYFGRSILFTSINTDSTNYSKYY